MSDDIGYRLMRPGEERLVHELVVRVFEEFVGPTFSEAGREEFCRCVSPDRILCRCRNDCFVLVGYRDGALVGMIEVSHGSRISLFFVSPESQGKGIGRELFDRARSLASRLHPDLRWMDVHSSVWAVPVYEKLGFRKTGDEAVEHGMRYVPMEMQLEAQRDCEQPHDSISGDNVAESLEESKARKGVGT